MYENNIVFSIFLIFTGAALLSTLVLYTRQSMLVAYILLGMLLGPWGLKWIPDIHVIDRVGEVGITFLLFLIGLHLDPKDLFHMLRKVTLVAVISSIIFAGIGFSVGQLFDYTVPESLIIGAAMMFSSTIIGLKLLPTTILHHQHTGEVMISVLLMQDIIAIIVLLFLHSASDSAGLAWTHFAMVGLSLPALIIFAFVCERYILSKLLARFDTVQEYVFLLAVGWCLGIAQLAVFIGLPSEIGAFIAGVSIATGPIALFIAENLKPLRDFFLVLFFFSIGANFDTAYLPVVILPAALLAALALLLKPWLFRLLLRRVGENAAVSKEVGVRLGQSSEFSLLVAYWAVTATPALISNTANYLIQAMTILTFIVSCYWVVWRYPTPLGLSARLKRD
jgi:Kef-type K+ transport system membrane component KefB